jgi:hypothetical protein
MLQENFSNLLGGLATGDMKAVQEGLMFTWFLSLRVRRQLGLLLPHLLVLLSGEMA